jgi:hypothetical protein
VELRCVELIRILLEDSLGGFHVCGVDEGLDLIDGNLKVLRVRLETAVRTRPETI